MKDATSEMPVDQYRLPRATSSRLDMSSNSNLISSAFTFRGTARIEVKVVETTKRVRAQRHRARDRSRLAGRRPRDSYRAERVTLDEQTERLTIECQPRSSLAPGS